MIDHCDSVPSLQNRRYFFAFLKRARRRPQSARRTRSERESRATGMQVTPVLQATPVRHAVKTLEWRLPIPLSALTHCGYGLISA